MNAIESYAVFRADLPDDATEVGGEVVTPAGRNILEAICRAVASTGVASTQPAQHSFYGWAAEFQIRKVTVWLLLQHPGPWLLIVEARAAWLTSRKTKSDALRQGIALVENALKADARFKELQWMTKEAYEASTRRRS